MDEKDFWVRLEFRVTEEFAGMTENHLRCLWCDGFLPNWYRLEESPPCISGRTWICERGYPDQEWDFVLFLPHPVSSREEIEWAALLPPDNVTRWLSMDFGRKLIQIEPAAAVPDPA